MSRMVAIAAGLVLVAGPVAAQQPDLLFQAEAQTLSGTCTGQPVRLEGNHNTVTLTGACGSLLLKGVSNTVRMGIVAGGSIHVEGSGNRVAFTVVGATPAIVALGPDNEVVPVSSPAAPSPAAPSPPAPPALARPVPAPPVSPPPIPAPRQPKEAANPAPKPSEPPTPPVPPPAGPLALTGDDAHRIETCTGRDVTVTGDRSDYLLQGGCKSLTVKGDLLTVQAEIAPGAKITITGRGSIVSWDVASHGHGPASVVHGLGSRVQPVLAEPVVGGVVRREQEQKRHAESH
jgi:hypothetical protein